VARTCGAEWVGNTSCRCAAGCEAEDGPTIEEVTSSDRSARLEELGQGADADAGGAFALIPALARCL
jgi:hypothetical protein